ncbi:MAG: molybdopterin-synthase adenylyltransferase MoeB [Pleurocapsa minor GSE-CHR-MK-17-07R]|jgi:adenylyltransferase/sulfurtransferase|nr:molybdopterin-synthase adenylyltransferase MoeB [Pleurocapsa minor GSE-CHR-MK 17-07R]
MTNPVVTKLGDLTNAEINRYGRHLIMPEFGLDGQRRLKAASVLLIGTGGLGSPLALYLAAAGVGRIGLVDYDIVEETNLQRQVIHGISSVGKSKIESAAKRILDINPNVTIDKYEVPFTSDNALEIAAPYDVIIDGTDNFPTRYLVNDVCVKLGKPNVYGSVLRFEGQLSVFYAQEGPCYRCMFPEPPPPGLVPSCAEGGVLGVLPGIIGTMQATEAVKLITGVGDPMIGRMLLFDALEMSFTTIKVRKNPKCPVCSIPREEVELIDYEQFCGVPAHDHVPTPISVTENGVVVNKNVPIPQITSVELKARIDAGEDLFLVDVRNPEEWEIAQIDHNLEIPKPRIMTAAEQVKLGQQALVDSVLNSIPRDREVIIYCRSGARSTDVITALRDLGFDPNKLVNLEGGILGWARNVDHTMPVY